MQSSKSKIYSSTISVNSFDSQKTATEWNSNFWPYLLSANTFLHCLCFYVFKLANIHIFLLQQKFSRDKNIVIFVQYIEFKIPNYEIYINRTNEKKNKNTQINKKL